MTAKERKKINARKLYVAMISIDEIAEVIDVTPRTVQNYKSEDAGGENDWDTLRASKIMNDSPDERANLLDNFVTMMHQAVKDILADEKMTSREKASAIASIGDSFNKMLKVARQEDPEAYKLSIVKRTLFTVLEHIKPVTPNDVMANIISVIDDKQFRDRITDV